MLKETIVDDSDNIPSYNIEVAKDDKVYSDIIPKNVCIKCCL